MYLSQDYVGIVVMAVQLCKYTRNILKINELCILKGEFYGMRINISMLFKKKKSST